MRDTTTTKTATTRCDRCTSTATTRVNSPRFGHEYLCAECAANVRRDRNYSGTNDEISEQPPEPDAGLWDEQFQLSGTMCAESTEKVDGLKLVTSTDGPEYGYAFVSPTLIDRLLVRLNSHAALVAALERLVAADNCNYDRDTMRSEGLFDAARLVLTQVQGEHRPSDGSEESR